MIDLSGSELHAVAAKALLGAGACAAVATEGATAALWLHAKGYNGTAAVVAVAQSGASAQSVGVSTVDLLVGQPHATTSVERVESPMLLVGLLGVAAARHGANFSVTCGDSAAAVQITPRSLAGPADTITTPLEITSTVAASEQRTDVPRALRVQVSDSDWRSVNTAAARIYVPSSERSRATGAGAGLTDND